MADSKNEEYLTYLVDMDQSELARRFHAILRKKKPTDSLGSATKCKTSGENRIRHYFDAIVDGNDVTNAKPDQKYS
jgi:beta-phosphoglucomutase